jgi:dihydroorotate dehydrogenase
MYKRIIRPILFLLQPETVHGLVVSFVKLSFWVPGVKYLLKRYYSFSHPSLNREVFGHKFKNPVGLAAGFDKNAEFYNDFDVFGFSFIEVGTITPKPQPGNDKPRSFRLKPDQGLINRMGFNNKGVINAHKNLMSPKRQAVIGGNIGKNTSTPNNEAANDYLECFKQLYSVVDYFVVNVSCPNISNLKDLQDVDNLREILEKLVVHRSNQLSYKPILLKISPDLSFDQLDESIQLTKELKIDGFVATNTSTSREGLITSDETLNNIGNGGLSGKPIKDRSTEVIRYISSKTEGKIPIIGVGGIMTEADAIEKLNAGASLIQIYSGFIYTGPSLVKRICKALVNNLE